MSFLDNIFGKTPTGVGSGGISPNWEEALAVLPLLLGSYEQGRPGGGAAIGNLLAMGGGLLGQHAAYRQAQENAAAEQGLLGGFNQKTAPATYKQIQQLMPQLGSLTPDVQSALIEKLLGQGFSEEKEFDTPKYWLNQKSGQIEQHTASEFAGNPVPPGLIPWGSAPANLAYEQGHGIANRESNARVERDTLAKATYGQDFDTLYKTNPKAAADIVERTHDFGVPKMLSGIEARSEEQWKNFEREEAIREANQQNMESRREADREKHDTFQLLNIPKSPDEWAVYTYAGMTPGQFQNLSPTDRAQVLAGVHHKQNLAWADRAGLSQDAKNRINAADAKMLYESKPIGEANKFFAVDPKNFTMIGTPMDTVKDLQARGAGFVPTPFEEAYTQSLTGVQNLDQFFQVGKKVLFSSGGYIKDKYSQKYYLSALDAKGDPDARKFLSGQSLLINALRGLTKTSRPNMAEINAAIKGLEGAGNIKQLQVAIQNTQTALINGMKNMVRKDATPDDREYMNSLLEKWGGEAGMGGSGAPGSALPADPGHTKTF